MKLRKGFSRALCLLTAINLIFTGCGSNPAVDEKATEVTSSEITTADVKSEPVKGGTLRLSMKKPDTLNPLKNEDVTVDRVLKLIFEPLFIIDNNMELKPNIAESIEISGNTVTIRLKDNLTWTDGKAIGADDVVYSLDVIRDASESSIYKNTLLNVRSYEQTGDKTVNIYYSNPVGAVGYNMAFPIIPKHYYKGSSGADMKPMGSGSFIFQEYKIAKSMRLTAFKGIKGEPYISEIQIKVMPDISTMISSISSNVTDILCVDIEHLGNIKGDITSNARLFTSNQFEFIGFNTRRKIFATSDLRRAVTYIMPIDDIIKGIYINNITKSITPVNPESVYADTSGVDTYNTDTSTANTLILASGLTKSDFSFKILVNGENSSRVESAKKLSQAFNAYGMNTGVEQVSFEDYQKRLSEGSFDMYLGGTELRPNMDLSALLGSQGSINFTGYQNNQLDSYISRVNASADFEIYKRSLNELNKFISYELPIVGIGFKKKALVCSDWINGEINPVFNDCFYGVEKWFMINRE